MNETIIGIIRAGVQAIAGAVVLFLFQQWAIEIDEAALELVLFGVATALYREVVNLVSRYVPLAQWLNGWNTTPNYIQDGT